MSRQRINGRARFTRGPRNPIISSSLLSGWDEDTYSYCSPAVGHGPERGQLAGTLPPHEDHVKRLGQLLIELGWISERDLTRALQSQEVMGGRLGTCLLEVDALSERLLDQALAHQLGVDAVRPLDLQNIPAEIYQTLPPKVARRCRAVPFRLLGGDLYVALLDVHNLDMLDEISFATGKSVRPRIANELRVELALERYYQHRTAVRYQQLYARLQEEDPTAMVLERSDSRITRPALEELGHLERTRPMDPLDTQPIRNRMITQPIKIGPAVLAALQAPAPTTAADSVEELIGRLSEADHRDDIGRALVDYLATRYERVALLMVRRDGVYGWMGAGSRFDSGRLLDYFASFEEPSLFLNLKEGGGFYAGALPAMASHQRLMACWNAQPPDECLVVPVRFDDRLVSILFCDPGQAGLRSHDLEELSDLAKHTAEAFRDYIMRTKRRAS